MAARTTGKYQIDMCQGPLFRQIITFTIPLIFSGILQLLFNAADLMIVGRFASHQALAAIGATVSLIHLIINIFIGLALGANVLVSRSIGAKDNLKCFRASQTAIYTALVGGTILLFIGVLLAKPALRWLNTPEDILDMSTLYMRIFFIGMPMLMLYNFGSGILRASGDTKRPFYFLLFAGIINVLLNLFFVLVFHWDVAGVAWATIISQGISAGLVLRVLTTTRAAYRVRLKQLRIDWKIFREMMYIGIPAGFQASCFSIANITLQTAMNSFGSQVIAGSTASSTLEGFGYVTSGAFGQASMNFVSQNYGGKKYDRIRRAILYSAISGAIVMLMVSSGMLLSAKPLLSLFNTDPDVIRWGVIRFHIILPMMFCCAFMEVFIGALRGFGYAIVPTVIMIFGICVYRLLWIWYYFPAHRSLQTLLVTYPVSWSIIVLASGTYIWFVLRRQRSGSFV